MPRPVNEQVVVITGASSGIGRLTALRFGAQGASVVLNSRNVEALRTVAREIEQAGGTALVAPADVAQWDEVRRLAETAVDRFGRIDTWVNGAALYLAGRVEDMDVAAAERLLQVNLLGQIYGMKAVLPHMIQQGGGTIINISSVNGVRSFPLLAAYSASKYAVTGFTEALRMELKRDHPNINVTTILPMSINTPFFAHGRSLLGTLPHPLPPIYEPEPVAEAIVFAAAHPRRDIYIGPGRLLAMAQGVAPGLLDRAFLFRNLGFRLQKTDQPDDGRDNFDAPLPAETETTTGQWDNESLKTSWFTRALELHPGRQAAVFGTALAGGVALARRLMR